MDFNSFFIDYKLHLKKYQKSKTKYNYTKPLNIIINIMGVLCILSGILILKSLYKYYIISLSILILLFFIITIYERTADNYLMNKLGNYYKPNSKNKMKQLILLLNDYDISPTDHDKIDLLINEAHESQKDYDYKKKGITIIKTLLPLVVSSISIIVNLCINKLPTLQMIRLIIMLLLFVIALYFALLPYKFWLEDIICYNYNKHTELIKDLRQLKIFYHDDFISDESEITNANSVTNNRENDTKSINVINTTSKKRTSNPKKSK